MRKPKINKCLYSLFIIGMAMLAPAILAAKPNANELVLVAAPVTKDPSMASIVPFTLTERELQQRELFAEFVELIETQRGLDAEDMVQKLAALDGYPLRSYAEKYWLLLSLSVESEAQMEAFLAANDNSPVARNVRKRWLQLLQDENQDELYVEYYQPQLSAELDCHYLQLTYNEEQELREFDQLVAPLWLVEYSQPKACDPIFKRWKASGLQTSDRVLARFKLASRAGNLRLAQFLGRSIAPEQKYLQSLWRDARRRPLRLTAANKFPGKYVAEEAEVFTYAMNRLAWSEPHRVISALDNTADRLSLSDDQLNKIVQTVALSLAVDQHPDAETWLQKAYQQQADPEILRWQVATAIRQQQWQQTIAMIAAAEPSHANDLSYQYWQGRSWQQLEAPEKAHDSFSIVAAQRHYYGFLASAQIQQVPRLNHREPRIDSVLQQALIQDPAIRRAHELFVQQRFAEARREWRFALREASDDVRMQAALLAHDWQWYDQAIALFTQLGYFDDVLRRFPIASNTAIQPLAQEYQIDPAWAFAITRRESSFMSDAVSGVGARGLMQVMPATARFIQQQPVRYSTLLEPQANVALGIQYLRYLMEKVDDNTLLATASYNAGWRRVLEWLPEQEAVDADIWIESIPYRETRNYVKAVLAYKYIYQLQLGQQSDLFEQLQIMQLQPRTTLATEAQ
ncbi:transglycosylase SLT domain-containing protein [Alteromonas sp. ASW11-36]|uniref:Transglycosylase SLT domain-containing protein n=1 Tax=Alteromonas arenosi TaxID=3055817 RepID=A0ABT7SZ83_9ALTE|nr:lytic transglycosylase domain-containing protein [Alteromonas sp. ASW11-36]MDM7861506.1 transglycosylase SLT domain-containing protein [Alteromonas sp. ASW11-36]